MIRKCFAVLFVAGAAAGCASPGFQGGQNRNSLPPGVVSVSSNQLIGDDSMEFRTPASTGWGLIRQPGSVNLIRRGIQANETFAAQVILFPLQPGDLMPQIQKGIQADSPSDRFEVVKAEYIPENKRGYPCVRHEAISSDKKARTGMWSTADLLLQISALYCRHPKKENLGFAAIYSHRGTGLHPGFEEEANSFINNVQIPKASK